MPFEVLVCKQSASLRGHLLDSGCSYTYIYFGPAAYCQLVNYRATITYTQSYARVCGICLPVSGLNLIRALRWICGLHLTQHHGLDPSAIRHPPSGGQIPIAPQLSRTPALGSFSRPVPVPLSVSAGANLKLHTTISASAGGSLSNAAKHFASFICLLTLQKSTERLIKPFEYDVKVLVSK